MTKPPLRAANVQEVCAGAAASSGGGGPFSPKAGSSKHGGGCTGEATGTDICDDEVTITYCDAVSDGTCPQEQVITRTWTSTDDWRQQHQR